MVADALSNIFEPIVNGAEAAYVITRASERETLFYEFPTIIVFMNSHGLPFPIEII